eukprot:g5506.t1
MQASAAPTVLEKRATRRYGWFEPAAPLSLRQAQLEEERGLQRKAVEHLRDCTAWRTKQCTFPLCAETAEILYHDLPDPPPLIPSFAQRRDAAMRTLQGRRSGVIVLPPIGASAAVVPVEDEPEERHGPGEVSAAGEGEGRGGGRCGRGAEGEGAGAGDGQEAFIKPRCPLSSAQLLRQLFTLRDPTKLPKLPKLLEKFKGRTKELLDRELKHYALPPKFCELCARAHQLRAAHARTCKRKRGECRVPLCWQLRQRGAEATRDLHALALAGRPQLPGAACCVCLGRYPLECAECGAICVECCPVAGNIECRKAALPAVGCLCVFFWIFLMVLWVVPLATGEAVGEERRLVFVAVGQLDRQLDRLGRPEN